MVETTRCLPRLQAPVRLGSGVDVKVIYRTALYTSLAICYSEYTGARKNCFTAGGLGPLPHSRYIGASPMAINLATFDVWYYTNASDTTYAADADDFSFAAEGFDVWAAATASAGGRHLHPSSRLWAGRDSGTILHDDGVGNAVPSPAAEWCAEAVQPGNLEVWASPLSGHRLAVSLLNRSPTAQNIRVCPGVEASFAFSAVNLLSMAVLYRLGPRALNLRKRRFLAWAGRLGGAWSRFGSKDGSAGRVASEGRG